MRAIRPDKGEAFDLRMKQQLDSGEMAPPADLWDNVAGQLDADRSAIRYRHWYKVGLMFFIPFLLLSLYLNVNYHQQSPGHVNLDSLIENMDSGLENFPIQLSAPALEWAAHLSNSAIMASISNNWLHGQATTPAANRSANNAEFIFGKGSVSEALATLTPETTEPPRWFTELWNSIAEPERKENKLSLDYTGLAFLDQQNLDDETIPEVTHFKETVAANFTTDRKDLVSGAYVGFTAGGHFGKFKIKNASFNPLIGEDAKFNFDKGMHYGIGFGYNFSPRFGLATEWIINSQHGSSYNDLRGGKLPLSGTIKLNYLQIPLLAKIKFTTLRGANARPSSINIIAGLQYSRLKSAEIVIEDEIVDNSTQYFQRSEIGLILGVEYDMFVHDNYFITFGARGSISTDSRAFPYAGKMDGVKSVNYQIGFNATINYQLPRLRKKMRGADALPSLPGE